MIRWLGALLVMATVSLAPAAWADPTATDRQEALKLGGEALDLFAAGDYRASLEKFEKADQLVPAPTLKLHIARCLDKLDRMTEAAEKFREVIATELSADAPAVHREARKEAVPELAALLEQIPTVRVTVRGPGATDARVTLDGVAFPPARLGEKMSIDPGHYRFEAIVGERRVARSLDLSRGMSERVVLHLPEETGSGDGRAPAEGDDGGALAWQIGGYAALGVGAVGLTVGTILGVMVITEEEDLEARCPDRRCPPEAHEDASAFDDKRIGSTVGFVIGGVGVAAGVMLLLLAPSAEEEARAVRPLFGPGYVGITGAF